MDDHDSDRLASALHRRIDELRTVLETAETAASGATVTDATVDAARLFRRDLIEISSELDADPASARQSWRRHIATRIDELLDAIREEVATVDQG
jgi:hypothetical protein